MTLADDASFLGQPLPQTELSITPSVSFLRFFRVHGVMNYRGGFKVYNSTAQFRCAVFLNCRGANDPSVGLEEQARIMASARAISGRNLATWTDYTGFDPEINFNGTSNFSTAEFLTQPQVRYFTARLSIGW